MMNPNQIIRYQDHYDFGSPSSPSPPPMYSPLSYRHPMFPIHYPSRYIESQHEINSGDESPDKSFQSNTIIDLQRRVQFLEEEISRKRDTIEVLQLQVNKYEQEKQAEKKKTITLLDTRGTCQILGSFEKVWSQRCKGNISSCGHKKCNSSPNTRSKVFSQNR